MAVPLKEGQGCKRPAIKIFFSFYIYNFLFCRPKILIGLLRYLPKSMALLVPKLGGGGEKNPFPATGDFMCALGIDR